MTVFFPNLSEVILLLKKIVLQK